MSEGVKEITSSALKLPRRSRALIADLLLDSLDEDSGESYEEEWLNMVRARDAELMDGASEPVNHENVIAAVRQAVQCSK